MATRDFSVYRLHFIGPVHISNAREDYGISLKTIASDTLYAAITATLAKMGESIPQDGDLGCVISSLFPYRRDTEDSEPVYVYYFPKPQCVQYENFEPAFFKQAKKMEWLEKTQFERALNGLPISICENPNFIRSEVSERVIVPRDYSEDSKPFYMDRLYFTDESGLFFMAEGDTTAIDKALPVLALEGIGTDRNVGNGFFDFIKDTITLEIPEETEYGMCLSVFIPESKEQLQTLLSSKNGSYDILRRGGWITTHPYNSLRKNAIYAFAAGSVLYGLTSGDGEIIDLAPQGLVSYPIWRCGKALVLPFKA